MNAERYILTGVIALCIVAFIVLTVIDKRPRLPRPVIFLPRDPAMDPTADRMELFMLTAIARGDAALAAYVATRNPQYVVDGVLDMRNRLAQGLDMPADELAERLQEEVAQ